MTEGMRLKSLMRRNIAAVGIGELIRQDTVAREREILKDIVI